MNTNGRRAKATPVQREEVWRLRAAGQSIRQIAAAVFEDARYHGRVERILRRPPHPAAEPANSASADLGVAAKAAEFAALSASAKFRLLFERRLAELLQSAEAPSMTELRGLMEVHRRLESLEQYERLRGLTAESE